MIAKSEHWDVSPGILLAVDAPAQRIKHDVISISNRNSFILTRIGVRIEDLWLSSAMLVSLIYSINILCSSYQEQSINFALPFTFLMRRMTP
jgi:hypothetical protein